jgi:hypothetical protein
MNIIILESQFSVNIRNLLTNRFARGSSRKNMQCYVAESDYQIGDKFRFVFNTIFIHLILNIQTSFQ